MGLTITEPNTAPKFKYVQDLGIGEMARSALGACIYFRISLGYVMVLDPRVQAYVDMNVLTVEDCSGARVEPLPKGTTITFISDL